MIDLKNINLEERLQDYEYTLRSVQNMNRITSSTLFQERDAETIFHYLIQEMELVSFKDYLKRYVYLEAKIEESYHTIPDSIFADIIVDSFKEKNAPYSFRPTTKQLRATVKSWLNQKSARREVVFLLGFGLGMSPKDVSDFLTKVLKEHDFDFYDPEETVFWFCYQYSLPFSRALKLIAQVQDFAPTDPMAYQFSHISQVKNEEQLLYFIYQGRQHADYERYTVIAFEQFNRLLAESKQLIAFMCDKNEDDISATYIEKIMCSGIPVNKYYNFESSSLSLLSEHFLHKRFTRQHINSILKKKLNVNRFDLITLLFFIYSQKRENITPETRYCQFIDEANSLLTKCGMMELYPVNPYESFILMCLLTDTPLEVYSEVWELSYHIYYSCNH